MSALSYRFQQVFDLAFSGDIIAVNAYRLGWKPAWTEERFLENMDEEIRATLEQGDKFKSSLYDSLFAVENK